MQYWHLPTVNSSTDKLHDREPGADAPRVESVGRGKPQVLFSHPECRAILVQLQAHERLGDHAVRQRAVVEVVTGRVRMECGSDQTECPAGSLVCLDPGERHAVYALEDSQLLLVLAPWAEADQEHLPRNATAAQGEQPVPPST
ncbi:MAG: hypothetical protein JWN41_477 [Thermoleophilia bacterium]|nr:hypothetical protein [Thermoleophilia bacterium]